jgi:phospholipase/carboxylesterase
VNDPHNNHPVFAAGAPLARASVVMVLLHGRGSTADDILGLAAEFQGVEKAERLAFLAPQAAGSTWYPNSFLAPRASNEPWLGSALARVESVVARVEAAGIARGHTLVCGFSQGACLATEFIASYPARYAGLIAFTGGLIGPPGSDLAHAGDLKGTPALFLSGDPDPHVPWSRVEESAGVLERMGAGVQARRFPRRSHTISPQELLLARSFVENILTHAPSNPETQRVG